MIRFIIFLILSIGSVHCTSDVSNPTPVYVVEGGEAVLQCGFVSYSLEWHVYNGSNVDIIASRADTINDSKYSTSTNETTGLYYRLHIKNVEVSDVKKYRCSGPVDGKLQVFYLQLILKGKCRYRLVIFKWKT